MKESSSRHAGDGSQAVCEGSGGAGVSTQSGGPVEGQGQGRGRRRKVRPLPSSAHCLFPPVALVEAAP